MYFWKLLQLNYVRKDWLQIISIFKLLFSLIRPNCLNPFRSLIIKRKGFEQCYHLCFLRSTEIPQECSIHTSVGSISWAHEDGLCWLRWSWWPIFAWGAIVCRLRNVRNWFKSRFKRRAWENEGRKWLWMINKSWHSSSSSLLWRVEEATVVVMGR